MKTRAERCRSRRGVKGRPSWVMPGQQSAPVGLEWFPASLGNILKRIDLGKMMIDSVVFFPNALVGPKVLVSKDWRWLLEARHCRLLITTWPGICFFQTKLAYVGGWR